MSLPFHETALGREFDAFADELALLPSSPDVTAMELRFAFLREAVAMQLAEPGRFTFNLPSSLFDA